MATAKSRFTLPGLSQDKADKVVTILQERLNAYNDLDVYKRQPLVLS